ncbi:MAG: lysylphosphatidylglycerol synthase domain-containing protein [Bacteroidota bacterium]
MQKWLKYLVYLSVAFLIWYLWTTDFLQIPEIKNVGLLVFSIVLLMSGYLTKSKAWQVGLKAKGMDVSLRDSVSSTGLAELGKYIPGKLWVILGRAGYISSHYDISVRRASGISLVVQFITIWSGILMAMVGIIFIRVPAGWMFALAAGWVLLSLILFLKPLHDLIQKLIKKLIKKELKLPFINLQEIRPYLCWYFFDWLVRMAGFYLLMWAVCGEAPSVAIAAGFPLAITLGILAVIAPGGLGVREGVFVIWFQAAGFDLATATSLSVIIRLWSLVGDVGIFALGVALKKRFKSNW